MLGVLITILFSFCMVGFGRLLYGRWMAGLDLAANVGIAGILGLGTVGLLTLFIGLLPGGLRWGIGPLWLFALAGLANLVRTRIWTIKMLPRKPVSLEWLFVVAAAVGVIFALVADLAPSGPLDWDTVAYHLAAPKIWLRDGQVSWIPYIHHSNFPLSVDNLYIWGLSWGDQAGAKAFQLCFYLLGMFCVFGLARQRYGGRAGAWAALTFATVPLVLWEAGTGYVDVAHGLYTGVGVVLAVLVMEGIWEGKGEEGTRNLWPIAALCLGFAAGSKYTGLQAFIAVGVAFGGYALIKYRGAGFGKLAAILGVACLVCAPWYVKNEIMVGNPVFPFFYEVFGGKNWDQYNADIYRNQQQIFGLPRTGPAAGLLAFPDAVMGLAFQPGRYTDPNPQLGVSKGQASGASGFAWQSTGAAIIAVGFVWLFSGKTRRFEGLLLGWIGFSFLMWFVLSQQSRYALSFAPILAILLGAGVVRLRAGSALAVVASVQALATFYVAYSSQFQVQLQVVAGKIPQDKYLEQIDTSYPAYVWLNENAKSGKVALYDDVLGFYLDIPYFWANPGHTTLIGYDKLENGTDFVKRLKEMGFTHIFVCTSSAEAVHQMRGAVGLEGPVVPFTDDQKSELGQGQKYKWLIGDAAAEGLLAVEKDFGRRGFILGIKP